MFQFCYRGIELANVPILNLWAQFQNYYELLVNTDFLEQFSGPLDRPIETPYERWDGMPDELVSDIFRRCFIGLESYTRHAVRFAADATGSLDEPVKKAIANPFSLGGGSVRSLYHRLPSLVVPAISLAERDKLLYDRTCELYDGFRNPLFHGFRVLGSHKVVGELQETMEHLRRLYHWIEFWPIEGWEDYKTGRKPWDTDEAGLALIFRTGIPSPSAAHGS